MGWMVRVLEFNSQWGLGISLFSTTSRPALGPTHPPTLWVPESLSPGVKQPGLEVDHHLLLGPRSRMCGAIPLPSSTFSWHGA